MNLFVSLLVRRYSSGLTYLKKRASFLALLGGGLATMVTFVVAGAIGPAQAAPSTPPLWSSPATITGESSTNNLSLLASPNGQSYLFDGANLSGLTASSGIGLKTSASAQSITFLENGDSILYTPSTIGGYQNGGNFQYRYANGSLGGSYAFSVSPILAFAADTSELLVIYSGSTTGDYGLVAQSFAINSGSFTASGLPVIVYSTKTALYGAPMSGIPVSAVVDSSGAASVIISTYSNASYNEFVVAVNRSTSGIWQTPNSLSQPGTSPNAALVSSSPNGRSVVTWNTGSQDAYGNQNSIVVWVSVRNPGGGYSSPSAISTQTAIAGGSTEGTSLFSAAGPDGTLAVAYGYRTCTSAFTLGALCINLPLDN